MKSPKWVICLAITIFVSVRKADGENYEPSSLRGMICSFEFWDVITMASKYLRTANLVKLGMSYPQNKLSLNRMARATHQTNLNHCWIVIYIECMRMGNLVWTTQQLFYITFGFLTPFFWHERSNGTLRHEIGGGGTYPCVLTATTWNIWKWMSAIPKHAQEGTEGTNDRSHKDRLKILNNQKSVQFRFIFCINQKSVQFRLIFCINQNDQSISQNQTIHFIFRRTQIYKNLQMVQITKSRNKQARSIYENDGFWSRWFPHMLWYN